jgi:hypothetical protein
MAAEHLGLHISRRQFVQSAGAVGLGLLAGCGRLNSQGELLPQLRTTTFRVGLLNAQVPPPDKPPDWRAWLASVAPPGGGPP